MRAVSVQHALPFSLGRDRARPGVHSANGPLPRGAACLSQAGRRRTASVGRVLGNAQRGTTSRGMRSAGTYPALLFFARIPMRCPSPINFPQVTFPSHCRFPEHKKSLRSLWVSVSSNWLTSQNKS